MSLNEDLARIMELAGTDPRFVSLVGALAEPCSCTRGYIYNDTTGEKVRHIRCGGSGRVLRANWPQGALAGVLLFQASKLAGQEYHDNGAAGWKWTETASMIVDCFDQDETDSRATKVFLEAMEKEAAHAQGTEQTN